MANDKLRKMKLHPKARPKPAEEPKPTLKRAGKRTDKGRLREEE